MKPLHIAYLLADTDMAGGIRVAVAQGDALIERGHRVTLIARGDPMTWRHSFAEWQHVESLDDANAGDADFLVGTFWTTIPIAHRLAPGRAIHLCQGYEGSFTAYRALKPDIDAAYRLPLPKITVSPHLVEICRRFHDDATWVGQIVDDVFFRERIKGGGPRLRVLLAGPAQADFKGIDVGYEAVRRAKERGADFDLIRVSQWAAAEDEPLKMAAEFHVGLPSNEMADLIAGCDVLLGPSRKQEGFGLPAAEAMACGVPAVLSEIPSFMSFDPAHDYALFAPDGDCTVMATQLRRVLDDADLRERLATRGREVVQQFRAPATGARLETYFLQRRRS